MRILATCLATASLALPAFAPAAEITYGGSSTVGTLLQGGIVRGFEERTGLKVRIVDVAGSGKGVSALASGAIQVAGAGRPITSAERRAGLVGTMIAQDGLAIYVNRKNPVKDLSRKQLADLFTGKVGGWKELGGREVRIVPIIEPLSSRRATVLLVQELVLEGKPYAPGLRELDLLTEQLAEVARTEGGICVASAAFLALVEPDVRDALHAVTLDGLPPTDENIRSGAYLLSRPINLVTKGPPEGDVKTFVDYVLSREGQEIVARFLVPLGSH